jgi:hypothetical protein
MVWKIGFIATAGVPRFLFNRRSIAARLQVRRRGDHGPFSGFAKCIRVGLRYRLSHPTNLLHRIRPLPRGGVAGVDWMEGGIMMSFPPQGDQP